MQVYPLHYCTSHLKSSAILMFLFWMRCMSWNTILIAIAWLNDCWGKKCCWSVILSTVWHFLLLFIKTSHSWCYVEISYTDWVFWPPLKLLWLVQWLSCLYPSMVILKLCEVCKIFLIFQISGYLSLKQLKTIVPFLYSVRCLLFLSNRNNIFNLPSHSTPCIVLLFTQGHVILLL